jgi:hypothetical protein
MWSKLDDGYIMNGKVLDAGWQGRELYIAALCYVSRNLTDGFVPVAMVQRLGALMDVPDPATAAIRLVTVGLWEFPADGRDGYLIHDYLKYNPSRAEHERLTAERSDAGRVGGTRSGETRRAQAASRASEASATASASSEGKQEPQQIRSKREAVPSRARPVPVAVPAPSSEGVPLPATWAVTPRLRAEAEAIVPGVDVDAEESAFRDHAATHGRLAHDWDAAFRKWFRTEYPKAMVGGRGTGHRNRDNRDNEGDEVAEGLRILGNLRRERAAPGPAIEAHWRAADD